jgi:Organic Anion Transporter Polypeptide (OATP) family
MCFGAALVSALAGAIGGFTGGFMMSRMRLTPVGAVRLMIFSTAVFTSGIFVIMWLGCPQLEMAGNIDPTRQT